MATVTGSAVVAALRDNERFVVTSHDNPDGDALGSLVATHLALGALGKDSVMVLGGPSPLPTEYRFLELERRGAARAAGGRRQPRSRRGRLRTARPRRGAELFDRRR